MKDEYIKALEDRIEELTSLLSYQSHREVMYLVEPKPEIRFTNNSSVTGSKMFGVFYATMGEAIIAYGNCIYQDPIVTSTAEEQIEIVKERITIYEYNIKTGAKNKVFG